MAYLYFDGSLPKIACIHDIVIWFVPPICFMLGFHAVTIDSAETDSDYVVSFYYELRRWK